MKLISDLLQLNQLNESAKAEATKVDDILTAEAEDALSKDAMYKHWSVNKKTKEVEWVTQATGARGTQEAAEVLAGILTKHGIKGWTVKVCVRDDYNPDNHPRIPATPWVKVKS